MNLKFATLTSLALTLTASVAQAGTISVPFQAQFSANGDRHRSMVEINLPAELARCQRIPSGVLNYNYSLQRSVGVGNTADIAKAAPVTLATFDKVALGLGENFYPSRHSGAKSAASLYLQPGAATVVNKTVPMSGSAILPDAFLASVNQEVQRPTSNKRSVTVRVDLMRVATTIEPETTVVSEGPVSVGAIAGTLRLECLKK